MSTMKKIGALIMALAMCFALAMPAFAADGNTPAPTTGSITITNAKDKVEVEGKEGKQDNTYTAYMIFAATPSGDSKDSKGPTASADGHVGYYATEAQKKFWEDKGLFAFTKAGDGNYVVSLAEGANAKKIAEYFNNSRNEIMDAKVLGTGVDLTYKNGEATVANLPFGYYFISSTNGSVVSIDTTNFDVHIEDKNTYGDTGFEPGDDNTDGKLKDVVKLNGIDVVYPDDTNNDGKKETPAVSVKIGDVVGYRVSVKTTNYVVKDVKVSENSDETKKSSEKVQYVYVTDRLEDGLAYDGDVTVKVDGEDAKGDVKVNKNGANFTVVLPWLDADGNALYTDGATVKVEYSAKVTAKIDMVGEEGKPSENGGNFAGVSYDSTPTQDYKPGDDDDDDPTPPNPDPNPGQGGHDTGVAETEVSVYSYALAIQKVDAKDHTKPLKDAHFTVADANKNTLTFRYNDTDKCYYYDPTVQTTDVVSDAEGEIVLKGVDAGTYTATETAAPAGYNLLGTKPEFNAIVAGVTKTSKKVTTTKFYEPAEDGTFVRNDDGTFTENAAAEGQKYKLVDTKTETSVPVTTTQGNDVFSENAVSMIVENGQGTELPSTGGMGTTMFYVVGGAMVLGAGVLLITKKRMAE